MTVAAEFCTAHDQYKPCRCDETPRLLRGRPVDLIDVDVESLPKVTAVPMTDDIEVI